MPKCRQTLWVVAFMLGLAGPATAQPFSNIVVFGDSLSDSGQVAGVTFTDPNLDGTVGTVFTQVLAAGLGLSLSPSNPLIAPQRPPANNYAVGGHTTVDIVASIVTESVFDSARAGFPGLVSRRPGYLVEFPRPDPTTLFVVSGGSNDLFRGGDPVETAARLLTGVSALDGAGARYILVINLPNLGAIPQSGPLGLRGVLSQATEIFNDALRTGLNASGANVIHVDAYSLLAEVLAAPDVYGFSGVDQGGVCFDGSAFTGALCLEDPVNGLRGSAPDPTRLVFYDGLHPTQAMHAITGAYALSVLAAPALISTLGEVPLTTARHHQLAIQNELAAATLAATPRTWSLFGSGSIGGSRVEPTGEAPAYDDDGASVVGGVAYHVNSRLMVGAALGFSRSEVEFSSADMGGFDLDNGFVSGFGRYRQRWFFADAIATLASLDYRSVRRAVELGEARRVELGDTSGDQFALWLDVGADVLRSQAAQLGPIISLQLQNVNVDAYREAGSRSTSMNFGDQARRSRLVQVGIFGAYVFGRSSRPVQVRGGLTRDKELRDDPRDVRAGVKSLAGSSFVLPARLPQDDAWTASVGLDAELRPGLTASASFIRRDDTTGGAEHLFVVGVQVGL